ncbi:pectinesterase-like [Nymphaea colorata]|nr:pectinesterase-like [Nymphaea colorata]
MASQTSPILYILLSYFLFSATIPPSSSSSSASSSFFIPTNYHSSICHSTPSPAHCTEASKLTIPPGLTTPVTKTIPTLPIDPVVLVLVRQILQQAYTAAVKLNATIATLESSGIVETQKGTILDCKELHLITLDLLQSCITLTSSQKSDQRVVRIYLSAALANKETCLEGMLTASGPFKLVFIADLESLYLIVRKALFVLSTGKAVTENWRRRLMGISGGFPEWLSRKDRRLLQSSGTGGYDASSIITVAKDGSGNFTTVSDAIAAVPSKSNSRVVVYVKEGIYDEIVEIPSSKQFVALLGDGMWRTVITGNRSVGDGWTTYSSATLAVSGTGFLARDLTIINTAGAVKHQAVALRVNADLSAIFRCSMVGFQDTLYVHSLRQFYRESVIAGTVDFIFGDAAVVFQVSQLVSRKPMDGQFNTITAQGRSDPNENTGISIDNCTILPDTELAASLSSFKTYFGRPWRNYSRTVVMTSYVERHVDPSGWTPWSGDDGLSTLYYGEYSNIGPGANTDGRVTWAGFHTMTYEDATNFTVPNLILGDQWLDSTAVPYDTGV